MQSHDAHICLHRACSWLGIEHVFLYDNNSEDGPEVRRQLESEFPSSYLSTRLEPTHKGQLMAYSRCAREARHNYNWVAFIDPDEFIHVRNGCVMLP